MKREKKDCTTRGVKGITKEPTEANNLDSEDLPDSGLKESLLVTNLVYICVTVM